MSSFLRGTEAAVHDDPDIAHVNHRHWGWLAGVLLRKKKKKKSYTSIQLEIKAI